MHFMEVLHEFLQHIKINIFPQFKTVYIFNVAQFTVNKTKHNNLHVHIEFV